MIGLSPEMVFLQVSEFIKITCSDFHNGIHGVSEMTHEV